MKIPKLQTAFQPIDIFADKAEYDRQKWLREHTMTHYTDKDYFTGSQTRLKGITVKGNKPARSYSGYSEPLPRRVQPTNISDITKGVHAVANPALAWFSPSQYVGAFRDTDNAADWFRSMMRGNSGFVTKEFEEKHPWISLATNMTGDAATLGGAAKGFKYAWEAIPRRTSNESINFLAKDIAPEGSQPSILNLNSWLSKWTTKSGKNVSLSEPELLQLFNTTKEDIRKYIFGDEFKQRVMNTSQFTEDEYKDLTKVLNERLNQTTFKGFKSKEGARNTYKWFEYSHELIPSEGFKVTAYPTHSMVQHRANMWHELWHSLGGTQGVDPNPLIQRLTKYNNGINPTNKSGALKRIETMSDLPGTLTREESITNFLKPVNPNLSNETLQNFAKDELGAYDFLIEDVFSKNSEVRSRMQSTLDRLRELGYDTKELITNPDKFIDWVNDLNKNRVNMPWDLQHLLMTYDIHDLAKYASRVLTTTGGIYTGNKYLLNNNQSSKQNIY